MKKRQFISTAVLGSLALPAFAAKPACPVAAPGPALLTISGAIGRSNRGALDPALDQMMAKFKMQFDKAFTFDFAALAALPKVTISPTLEYDNKPHKLSGPLLLDVLKAAAAQLDERTVLHLFAVDGYRVEMPLAEARDFRFIIATHLDEQPIPLGGLGPLWAVFDADRFPDVAKKPVNQRFPNCPWALYYIDIQRKA
jgi:hypothetical protein